MHVQSVVLFFNTAVSVRRRRRRGARPARPSAPPLFQLHCVDWPAGPLAVATPRSCLPTTRASQSASAPILSLPLPLPLPPLPSACVFTVCFHSGNFPLAPSLGLSVGWGAAGARGALLGLAALLLLPINSNYDHPEARAVLPAPSDPLPSTVAGLSFFLSTQHLDRANAVTSFGLCLLGVLDTTTTVDLPSFQVGAGCIYVTVLGTRPLWAATPPHTSCATYPPPRLLQPPLFLPPPVSASAAQARLRAASAPLAISI
jgi:hypothetical protein